MGTNRDDLIAAARAAAETEPALRATFEEQKAAHREAETARDIAAAADAKAREVAERAGLPGAWRALLGGRYRAERGAADENAKSTAAELSRRVEVLRAAAARLRTADRELAEAQKVAAPLPELLRRQRLDGLRAAGDPASVALLGQVETAEAGLAASKARLKELEEAYAALGAAQHSITVALDKLASAGDWGTYDTFFGGGVISSSIKHDRIMDADDATVEVRRAWEVARKELADVDLRPELAGPQISRLQRGLDIWFDNIFTDLSVQGKIREQEQALRTLSGRFYELADRLRSDAAATTEQVKAARAERARLLDRPGG